MNASPIEHEWLAGLLEGEGSFFPTRNRVPVISLAMCDEDVVRRAALIMDARVHGYPARRAGTKPTFQFALRGDRAHGLMLLLAPWMGARRRARIGEITGMASVAGGHAASGLAWLSGLLEGEGWFGTHRTRGRAYPGISIQMTDQDTVERAARMLGAVGRPGSLRDQERWAPTFCAALHGVRAADWMRTLRPFMGERRRAQIDRALAAYRPERLPVAPAHCTVAGCSAAHRSRGLCHRHYMSWARDVGRGRTPRVTPLR